MKKTCAALALAAALAACAPATSNPTDTAGDAASVVAAQDARTAASAVLDHLAQNDRLPNNLGETSYRGKPDYLVTYIPRPENGFCVSVASVETRGGEATFRVDEHLKTYAPNVDGSGSCYDVR